MSSHLQTLPIKRQALLSTIRGAVEVARDKGLWSVAAMGITAYSRLATPEQPKATTTLAKRVAA